jgi:hypothetical protein
MFCAGAEAYEASKPVVVIAKVGSPILPFPRSLSRATYHRLAPFLYFGSSGLLSCKYEVILFPNTTSLVLPLPTGSGKTEGTCVYAAMQAELNTAIDDSLKPVGIVIITRLTADADRIADKINTLSRRAVAVAHHTKNKADAAAISNSDILVVTHQAFLNAAKSWGAHEHERWDRISVWKGGRRHLVIIDEALANVVEGNKVTVDNLSTVKPLSLREDAVELHHHGFRTNLCLLLVLGPQRFLEPREALLWSTHHPCGCYFQSLWHLSAHVPDAVFVLDQSHANTHHLIPPFDTSAAGRSY